MPYALILTSAPLSVGSTTITGRILVKILCGLSGTDWNTLPMSLGVIYSTALAPARLLLDVPVVEGCDYLLKVFVDWKILWGCFDKYTID